MQTTHNLEPALKTRPDRAEYGALRMTELPTWGAGLHWPQAMPSPGFRS
ncbi:hypothetical protein [Dongia sp. agr-C8]